MKKNRSKPKIGRVATIQSIFLGGAHEFLFPKQHVCFWSPKSFPWRKKPIQVDKFRICLDRLRWPRKKHDIFECRKWCRWEHIYVFFFPEKLESPANYCISSRFSQISAHFKHNMGTNVCPSNLRTRSSTSLPYQGAPLEVCCGSRLLEEGPGHSPNFAECWLLWEKIVGQSGLVGILASNTSKESFG